MRPMDSPTTKSSMEKLRAGVKVERGGEERRSRSERYRTRRRMRGKKRDEVSQS